MTNLQVQSTIEWIVRTARSLAPLMAVLAIAACGGDDGAVSTPTPTAPPNPSATNTARLPTTVSVPTPTATPANQPPIFNGLHDYDLPLGGDLLLQVVASDPDGQTVTVFTTAEPTSSYFLPDSGVFCFFASVDEQVGQTYHVTFVATDGQDTTSQTIAIHIIEPGRGAGTIGVTPPAITLEEIGDRNAFVGEELVIQLVASGASPIVCKMMTSPQLAPLVQFDGSTGLFRFTPTAAQAGKSLEFTFQACVLDTNNECSTAAQTHQTIRINVAAAPSCPDYIPPSGCSELKPGDTLPQPLSSCYYVKQQGTYVYDLVNILDGGALYFQEDPTGPIDFQVRSMLVEYGGTLQAGSPNCPFGANGGKLSFGLYGNDPSMQGATPSPTPGIECLTNTGADQPCFPASLDHQTTHYCTVTNSKDTCSSTTTPGTDAANYELEHYGKLNFDNTSFGYKTLSVSYGGTLRFFGYKGAKLATGDLDPPDHCAVPPAKASTLDKAEMLAWAELTGSSWVRLQASQDVMVDNVNQTQLTLDRVVPDWAVGDEIVVTTTDWYPSHSEQRTVRKVATSMTPAGMRTVLNVDALLYPHSTQIFDAAALQQNNQASYTGPVNREAADLRAAVGLLSRSIQVRSLGVNPQTTPTDPGFPEVKDCLADGVGDKNPDCYFGGHVMFRQGFREVQIRGAEFKQLGQGARMGHYPVHFHLAKSTAYTQGKAYVKDSSIWDSMTRFITVHGTHDVTLARNVGFLSVGHGFYFEDGSEIDNLLCHNLGVSARGALKEYYEAQADPANWENGAPSPASRFVPPILDGVCAGPDPESCSCANPPPAPTPCPTGGLKKPSLRTGSDTYMPVTFWLMNAYNEVVGNYAAGVYGFGSCFWLLSSGVSGPSFSEHDFAGFANYNHAGAYQAPLLRFRGNSCTTATYGLPASAEVSPAALGEAANTGYTPVDNPYIVGKLPSQLGANYLRPAVVGNFQPIEPNPAGVFNCSSTGLSDSQLNGNVSACVTTVIDRFTTSFNWAERNYGSIWLRPWFYLLLNSAVTDQLFGGVTFVSAGSWLQVPPGYFSLAKNSLFVGTTQYGGSRWARRSGPLFEVTSTSDVASYAPCAHGGKITCNLEEEGTGFWTGGFQPKRLINIYDGPHFADGNLFLNVGAWQCDPQPCIGKSAAACEQFLTGKYGDNTLPCGIYSSTAQPAILQTPTGPIDPNKMIVLDAAVGWKQPNGFYYPPAFTYRASTFFKSLPVGLPNPDPMNPLNQCYSFGPNDDYMEPSFLPGDCRHNVIDRTRPYIAGNMIGIGGGPGTYPVDVNNLPVTPIDFSTILLDLDGTLTGSTGMLSGLPQSLPSTSLSRNSFFDAPAQTDECLSFGLQTSPYEFVTSIVAPLAGPPSPGVANRIAPLKWPDPADPTKRAGTPMVAIYRQWELAEDPDNCGQVCLDSDLSKYGCTRAAFMVGPNVGQAPYLTMAEPPGLMSQTGSLYYIDTSSGAKQPINCVVSKTGQMFPAPFSANESYVVYDLFARNDAVLSYQLYVGENVANLAAINGHFVRVNPHIQGSNDTLASAVTDACVPGSGGWCANLPVPTIQVVPNTNSSVLTVTLDQRPLGAKFETAARQGYEQCMPRDLCYFDGATCQPCLKDPSKCIRQGDFLPVDVESLNQPDATGMAPLDVICRDWAGFASGTAGNTLGEISLVDCPAGGCLGFAFTLPGNFVGDKTYAQIGAPLAQCFNQPSWDGDKLVERTEQGSNPNMPTPTTTPKPADPLCGPPRPAVPADFCAAMP